MFVVDDTQLVHSEMRGSIAWIIIDSPANRNALGGAVLRQLIAELTAAYSRPDVRAVVLTGTGTVFSSGADLRDTSDTAWVEQAYRALFEGILNAEKPVIGRLNGHCFGGAVGLAAVCDLSIAVDDAKFGFPEVRLGRVATLAAVVSLPRLRAGDAADLLLRGNRFDGSRAAALGLVNTAVPLEELDSEVDAVLEDLLAGGPKAISRTKFLMRQIRLSSEERAWDLAFALTREINGTPEAVEGSAAFRERRAPDWPTG